MASAVIGWGPGLERLRTRFGEQVREYVLLDPLLII